MAHLGILVINELAAKKPGCIRFDKGSAMYPFPEEFLPAWDSLREQIKGKYFFYPHTGGEEELREQIVFLEKTKGRKLKKDQMVITHGGMSGLTSLFTITCEKGDEILTNTYSFEGFGSLAEQFKLKQRRIDFSDPEAVKKAITKKTKLLILNSPENPTGKVYSQREIDALVEIATKKNVLVISDEVMHRIVYAPNRWYGPSLENDRVVVVDSFAKNWFIPGVRTGWIATKNKTILKKTADLLALETIGVNLFSQLFMTDVLKNTDYSAVLATHLKELAKRKQRIEKIFEKEAIDYKHEVQGGMNFYINMEKDAEKAALELLKKSNLAVIPGRLFEGQRSTFARLGFGAVTESQLVEGLAKLTRFLRS